MFDTLLMPTYRYLYEYFKCLILQLVYHVSLCFISMAHSSLQIFNKNKEICNSPIWSNTNPASSYLPIIKKSFTLHPCFNIFHHMLSSISFREYTFFELQMKSKLKVHYQNLHSVGAFFFISNPSLFYNDDFLSELFNLISPNSVSLVC